MCEILVGLADEDKRELEALIKAAVHNPRLSIGLAIKMMPTQGNIEDFAYGLVSGMIIGNFLGQFLNKNGRQPDKDETKDILSIMMIKMPRLRMSIMKELDLR